MSAALAAVTCAGGTAMAATATAADNSPAASVQLVALIGDGPLQPRAEAAVVRLGPEDADWSDLGAPIDLPFAVSRVGRRGGGFIAPNSHDNLTCLTQAVYYEARSQSLAGQQGVAQVVMNRTHSAEFPSGVCDVVFQRTGHYGTCQFTFVCDGSMNRRLVEQQAWDKAHEVASSALNGFVYAPLKDAMHYHAAWMTPYWAPSLTRIGQVDGQIFYH